MVLKYFPTANSTAQLRQYCVNFTDQALFMQNFHVLTRKDAKRHALQELLVSSHLFFTIPISRSLKSEMIHVKVVSEQFSSHSRKKGFP